jgi:4-hydroxybenzoate polyprenyltransferase
MIKSIIKTMRPRQWVKNAVVIAALVFDRQLPDPLILMIEGRLHPLQPLLHSLAAFCLFCLISSAVYIINDILDAESDRRHPTKKYRPIASGELSVPAAWISAVIIASFTFAIAYQLSLTFLIILFAYFLANLAYSNWLKHIPLIDVFVIAVGFVLRVAAGVSVIEVQRFSPWLYVVTTLLALYLGFGKRRAELALLAKNADSPRRVLDGYTIPLLDQLILIVSSTTIVSYSLYTFSAPNLPSNHTMMLTIPFVLYGIFRYLYLIQVKQEGGAPEELLLADRPLQASIILWGISILLIFYLY